MPTQLVKLALIDPSGITDGGDPSTADIETFSIFQEGAQDASRQVFSIEPNIVTLEDGSELIESKTYALDVAGVFNQSKRTKLAGWSKNRTPLWISGYGLDGQILYGYGAITSYVGTGTNMSFKFRMQNEAAGGYDASTSIHSSFMSYSTNGFSFYKWEENPDGASQTPVLLNGSQPPIELERTLSVLASDPDLSSGSPSKGWASGWRVQCDVGDVLYNYSRLWFPFSGETIYFGCDTVVTAGGSATNSLVNIRAKGSDNSELVNKSSNFQSGTQQAVSASLPTGTQSILFTIKTGEDTTVIWNNFKWSVGSLKPYTEFYT